MIEWLRRQTILLPVLVLLLGLLGSSLVALQLARVIETKDRERFEHNVDQTHDAIGNRLETYIAILRAGAGLFAASRLDVERAAFAAFVSRLQIETRYPGIQGIGFSIRLPPEQRDELIRLMHRQGVEDFRVWPSESRPEYHSIVYLEPLDRRNRAAIGYDMFTEPIRRAAMERARDTGLAAASGKVELVQEIDENKQPGFLIYVPTYRGGSIPGTVTKRREALIGFVYAPFRVNDLLHGIFATQRQPRLHFTVYEGPTATPSNLLYRSQGAGPPDPASADPPQYTTERLLDVAGRIWTIAYTSRPEFVRSSSRQLVPPFVFGGGVFASMLVSGLLWAQVRARATAEQAGRTARLRAREFEIVNRTGRELAGELDLDRLVQSLTDAGTELAGAEFGAFFYNVQDATHGESYMLYALSGAPREAFSRFPMPRNTAVFGPTFRGEGVIRSNDITKDPRYGKNLPYRGMPKGHLPVRSYLAVPVVARSGEVVGGLFFGHARPGVFTERTERVIAGIASQAAVAIDNAQLYRAAQTEIAERKRAEAHQKLLHDELNHRVKNTLASVQSIAAQTLRSAESPESFRQSFEARLLALSHAHNLLARGHWEGVSLRDLLTGILTPYGLNDYGKQRIVLDGKDVQLAPQTAITLGMGFHELATNAAKYGALSVPGGHVQVDWRTSTEQDRNLLCIRWIESGGPRVETPRRRGFGSRMIERGLAQELQGDVRLSFEPAGVRCIIEMELSPKPGDDPPES